MRKGCSYTSLKWIAAICMFIDHANRVFNASTDGTLYHILLSIGRCAFPIYCFLIAEGATHTRSRLRYFLRILTLGIISIVPWNIMLGFRPLSLDGGLNVCFTLCAGLTLICMFDIIDHINQSDLLKAMYKMLAFILVCIISVVLRLEYSVMGITLIASFYVLRDGFDTSRKRSILLAMLAGILGSFVLSVITVLEVDYINLLPSRTIFNYILNYFFLEFPFILAFIPILVYNGSKGKGLPHRFFYLFYPVHMLLLIGLARLLCV